MTVTEFILNQVPFLMGLSGEQAHALAAAAQQQNFTAGQTVLFRGTTVDGLYVVASGSVSVWIKPAKGGAAARVAELRAGEVFGEMSILESGTAVATIKAADGGALVFLIPQEAFQAVMNEKPELRARAQALLDSRKQRNGSAGQPVPVAA